MFYDKIFSYFKLIKTVVCKQHVGTRQFTIQITNSLHTILFLLAINTLPMMSLVENKANIGLIPIIGQSLVNEQM